MNIERNRSRRGFRTTMDIGMGIFYIVIGLVVILYRSFGNLPIPTFIAYILGVMMVIGGAFRFYRGLKDVLPRKKNEDDSI